MPLFHTIISNSRSFLLPSVSYLRNQSRKMASIREAKPEGPPIPPPFQPMTHSLICSRRPQFIGFAKTTRRIE